MRIVLRLSCDLFFSREWVVLTFNPVPNGLERVRVRLLPEQVFQACQLNREHLTGASRPMRLVGPCLLLTSTARREREPRAWRLSQLPLHASAFPCQFCSRMPLMRVGHERREDLLSSLVFATGLWQLLLLHCICQCQLAGMPRADPVVRELFVCVSARPVLACESPSLNLTMNVILVVELGDRLPALLRPDNRPLVGKVRVFLLCLRSLLGRRA